MLLVCKYASLCFAGQGDFPQGMQHTWKSMLRKSLPPSLLSQMKYAIFGLGDSGYVQFNVVAKKLDRRLEQLGGKRLIEKGLGDDQVLHHDPCGCSKASKLNLDR